MQQHLSYQGRCASKDFIDYIHKTPTTAVILA